MENKKKASFYSRMKPYIKGFQFPFILAVIGAIISATITVIGPDKLKEITNTIMDGLTPTKMGTIPGVDLDKVGEIAMTLAILYGVSAVVGYLKGKSALMIFDRHANLKYKYGNRHFWCRGYYVDTVGRNKKAIEEYIRNQLSEDIAEDQISMKEYIDPFTGSKSK